MLPDRLYEQGVHRHPGPSSGGWFNSMDCDELDFAPGPPDVDMHDSQFWHDLDGAAEVALAVDAGLSNHTLDDPDFHPSCDHAQDDDSDGGMPRTEPLELPQWRASSDSRRPFWQPADGTTVDNPPIDFDDGSPFHPAVDFVGGRVGWVFKRDRLGVGYYLDEPKVVFNAWAADCAADSATSRLSYLLGPETLRDAFLHGQRTIVELDALVPADIVAEVGSTPSGKRQTRKGGQSRYQRRKAFRLRTGRSFRRLGKESDWHSNACTFGVNASDDTHGTAGLWAFDTYNSNCFNTAVGHLERSSADFVLIQEAKVLSADVAGAQIRAAAAGWNVNISPASSTVLDGVSAGTMIACRFHLGMTKVDSVPIDPRFADRITVSHVRAVCRGGIFLLSAYFKDSEGLSVFNLDLLQELPRIIRALHGPWMLAADFNMTPALLLSSGWLSLVQGVIAATKAPTCRGKEDDYWVVCAKLGGATFDPALVRDTAVGPHSAVRLWLQGKPRSNMVRAVRTPLRAPPDLPLSCDVRDDTQWDRVFEGVGCHTTSDELSSHFKQLVSGIERQVANHLGLDDVQGGMFMKRADGASLYWHTALGKPSSGSRKFSLITAAWQTVARWARDVAVAASPISPPHLQLSACRAKWLLLSHSWQGIGHGIHASALRGWLASLNLQMLDDRQAINWIRLTASGIAARTAAYDASKSDKAWNAWITDGGPKRIGRLHSMSRNLTGWIPSLTTANKDCEDDADGALSHDDNEISELDVVLAPTVPMDLQMSVDSEAQSWGKQWLAGKEHQPFEWPRQISPDSTLPDLCVQATIDASNTFSRSVGLGWDKLHPRAVARCSLSALSALVRFFMLVELLGYWPTEVGCILICLIPKSDSGRRPIGLLPSLIRWWMRARLDVVRAWQHNHERPYFYAGPGKGADVACWCQAARADLAAARRLVDHANVMSDLVKAFERVPHFWLAQFAHKYDYPVHILRLSISAYRLARVIVISGVSSDFMYALRGITAGAVHATIELRLLLIDCMDRIHLHVMYITITVYVDDASFEAMGSERIVQASVTKAVRMYTQAVEDMGMEMSTTKNVCIASTPTLASAIVAQCPGLGIKVQRAAKSLGGSIGTGRNRTVAVQRKRLEAFKARKARFRKLRRRVGAEATALVLRTGGTAAMVYGEASMGVSPSFLHAQRVVVAAAACPSGAGDLDLTLILADGGPNGEADPAFPAHQLPIGKWAQAVWHRWLPIPSLQALVDHATLKLGDGDCKWSLVSGPALAFQASARRIGWQVRNASTVVDEVGVLHDFTEVPPARIAKIVHRAVTTWRWRRVEARFPHAKQGDGGHGFFLEPVRRLLKVKDSETWGGRQKSSLRSAFLNRQWPQARLFQAGRASTPTCQLCVATGVCHDGDRSPQFAGTCLHRVLTCPALQSERQLRAPAWILDQARKYVANGYRLDSASSDLLIRAIAPSLAPRIDAPPSSPTFKWIVPPPAHGLPPQSTVYIDGSRLFAEQRYFGLCARQAWAFVILSSNGRFLASASGTTPGWAVGIHAAELWGLHQALHHSNPDDLYRTDCLAVKLGADKGVEWATAAERVLGQIWAFVAEALDGRVNHLLWMPAHCGKSQISNRHLSDGSSLSPIDVAANDYADEKAKAEARALKPPKRQLQLVVQQGAKLTEAARWLGQVTALANRFPLPRVAGDSGRQTFARDSSGTKPAPSSRTSKRPRSLEPAPRAPGDLSGCGRWEALRQRVLSRTAPAKPLM